MAIEYRYGDLDGLRNAADDLVRLHVDVIVTGGTPAALAVKRATNTIPIVVDAMADPVRDGLVASLARPGGNITGNTFLGPELIGKRFGLLKEAVPGLSRVAALWQPDAYGESTMSAIVKDAEDAARALGLQLQLVPVRGPNEFEDAFAATAREHADALIQLPSPMLFREYKRIAELAAKHRLPSMYAAREFVEAGGLMAYGAN